MSASVLDKVPCTRVTSHPNKLWTVGTLSYTTGGLVVLFGWLLWGDFAWSMRDRIIPPVMQILFGKYGCSDTEAALYFSSLPSIFSLLFSPFISYVSDRHRGRWGRRIPFIFFSTPFIVGSICGLAFSPEIGTWADKVLGAHSPGLNASVLTSLVTFCLIFDFFCGTAGGIFGALTNDVVPQQVMGRFFGLFRAVSLIVGSVVSYWFLGAAERYYAWFFLGIGMLYGVGFTLMCLKVKEGDYPPPPAKKKNAGWMKRFLSAAKTYWKDGFGHSYYRWFFASTILAGLVFVPVNLYLVFYAKSIGMDMDDFGKYIGLSYGVSLCLAYPLGLLADRFHPLRLMIVSLGLYVFVDLWGFAYARDPRTFGIVLVAHCIISGCFFTVASSISQRLLPRNKFAEIGSAGGIIASLVGIAFAPTLGVLLDHIHHNYRYTFYISFVLTLLALSANLILHRKFMRLGGPDNYIAPENSYAA